MANTYIQTVQGIAEAVNIFNSIGEKRVDGYREWLASQYAILDNSFRQEVARVGGVGATITEENLLQKLEELRAKKFALIEKLPGDMKKRLSSYAQVLISNSQAAVMESFRDIAVKEYLFTMNAAMENYYQAGDMVGMIRVAKKADEDNVLSKSQVMEIILPKLGNMLVDMAVSNGVDVNNVPAGELLSMWKDVIHESLSEYGADKFDGLIVNAVSKVVQERLAATEEKVISTTDHVRKMVNEGQITEAQANAALSKLYKDPYLTETAKMRLDMTAMGINMATLYAIGKSFYDDMAQKYPKDSSELTQAVENKYVNDAKAAMKQFLVYHDLKEVENSKAFMDILTAVESSIRSYAQRREGGIYDYKVNSAWNHYLIAKSGYIAKVSDETRKNLQVATNGLIAVAIELSKEGDHKASTLLLERFIQESPFLVDQGVLTGQTKPLVDAVIGRNTQTDAESYKRSTIEMVRRLFPEGVSELESIPGWEGFGVVFNKLLNTTNQKQIMDLAKDPRYEILEKAILLATSQNVTITKDKIKAYILEVQKTESMVKNVKGEAKVEQGLVSRAWEFVTGSTGKRYLELIDNYTRSELKTFGEEKIAPMAIKELAKTIDFKELQDMNILGFSNVTRMIGKDNIMNLEMDVPVEKDGKNKTIRLRVTYKIDEDGNPIHNKETTKMMIVKDYSKRNK